MPEPTHGVRKDPDPDGSQSNLRVQFKANPADFGGSGIPFLLYLCDLIRRGRGKKGVEVRSTAARFYGDLEGLVGGRRDRSPSP